MNKKALTAVVAVSAAAAMIMTGCNASSARAASAQSENTAKRTDTVMKRMDTFSDKDFKFPQHFGHDFFIKEDKTKTGEVSGTQTETENRGENNARVTMNPQTRASARRMINENPNRYQAKHYKYADVNMDNEARVKLYERLDDLYLLCADLSAANKKQDQKKAEIREQANLLRKHSKELKGKKIKTDWGKFNTAQKNTKKSLDELYKDRGKLSKRVRTIPKSGGNINVDAMTSRYSAIMNKMDARLNKLDKVHNDLYEMNRAASAALGKPMAPRQSKKEVQPEQPKGIQVTSKPINSEQVLQPKTEPQQPHQEKPIIHDYQPMRAPEEHQGMFPRPVQKQLQTHVMPTPVMPEPIPTIHSHIRPEVTQTPSMPTYATHTLPKKPVSVTHTHEKPEVSPMNYRVRTPKSHGERFQPNPDQFVTQHRAGHEHLRRQTSQTQSPEATTTESEAA